ncbi:MAG: fimbrillin family protein [Bacteroidales bacterium]|nr:fimbrillin family protein [Bacteroidales bacterium]
MKKTFTKIFSSAVALLTCAAGIFAPSCTRDDNSLLSAVDTDKQLSFTATTANFSASTKSGSASTILSSEYMGSYQGEALYLTAVENDWPVELAFESNKNNQSEIASKASEITTANITNNSIGVMVYSHANGADVSTWDLHSGLVEAEYVTAAGKWVPKTTIYWPALGKNAHFFAYAPYNTTAIPTSSVTAAAKAYPTIAFTVNSDYTKQVDLVVAEAEVADNPTFENISQGLTFKHALSGIRFKVATGVEVKAIEISGVNSTGTLALGSASGTMEWSNVAIAASFTIAESSGNLTTKSESGDYISLADKYTLMMVPTITSAGLPAGAQITVTFSDNTTLTSDISGHKWEQGKMITYLIAKSTVEVGTYTFTAVAPTDITYKGWTSTETKVISYREYSGNKYPVEWRVEGYYKTQTSAENKNFAERYSKGIAETFINTVSPIKGAGSESGESVEISYASAKPTITTNNKGAARNAKIVANNATLKGAAGNPWNLANRSQGYGVNTSTYTANTYIINGAGYYCFPLVMGNGVKGGNPNAASYNQSNFRDYKDQAINDPYLHKSSSGVGVPTYAVLAWADYDFIEVENGATNISSRYREGQANFKNWVTNGVTGATNGISKSGDVYYANFYVPAAKATKQGVACIVIMDATANNQGQSGIMWSYLIWLTDYEPGLPTSSSSAGSGVAEDGTAGGDADLKVYPLNRIDDPDAGTGPTITMMARNIGYVEDGVVTRNDYPASEEVWVRLEQSGNDGSVTPNYQVIKLQRPAASESNGTLGHNPYYQWGRPFAMKPATGVPGSSSEPSGYSGFYPPSNNNNEGYQETFTLGKTISLAPFFITRSGGGSWYNAGAANLWDANNAISYPWDKYDDAANTVKTIYDPSPAGYKVPRFMSFNSFMQNNTKEYDRAYDPTGTTPGSYTYFFWRGRPNAKGSWDYGCKFYGTHYNSIDIPPTSAATTYFPVTGCRASGSGALTDVSAFGYAWLAVPGSGASARSLGFSSSRVYPQNYNTRTNAFPVRPVKE